jgi:hypothetical protein
MASCRLTVILDIDETLVHYFANRHKSHSWDLLPESEKAKYRVEDAGSGIFIVRPHLDEFFDFLAANCDVGLWTWSDKGYATGMKETILPSRKLKFILHDDHAEESAEAHGNSKDLNYLWYGKPPMPCVAECNTILIDDLPANAANTSNIKNSITIEPFAPGGEVKERSDPYKDSSGDTALLEVIEILKKILGVAKTCYTNDEERWANIFSKDNVARAGLEGSLRNIKMKSGKIVRGIGAGKSHFFIKGGNRKTLRHRKFKKTSRGRTRGNRRRS